MTGHALKTSTPTALSRLADDYLSHCRARGLSPRSEHQYTYSIHSVFLPWCEREGITDLSQLDRRAVDRYTSELLSRTTPAGRPLSRHSVATYIRPIRLLLNWASREGEAVTASPQLPRRERPIRDVLSRAELDQLELAMPRERDKLIIRIFADCGLRLEELTRLTAGDLIRGGRQAHLRVHGKRDRIRDVPVPPSLIRRLERLIAARPEERSSDAIFLAERRGPFGDHEALTSAGPPIAPAGRPMPGTRHVERSPVLGARAHGGFAPATTRSLFQLTVVIRRARPHTAASSTHSNSGASEATPCLGDQSMTTMGRVVSAHAAECAHAEARDAANST